MSEHGFERIDSVLANLTAQMDAALEKQLCAKDGPQGAYRGAVSHEPPCGIDGPILARHPNISDLFEKMNARFEDVAKRLRLSDQSLH